MKRRALARVAGLAAALLGCVDYRLVEPDPGLPPGFIAFLTVVHDDSARYTVNAYFVSPAGTGDARAMRDTAILVGGVRVEPSGRAFGGAMSYEWRETRPASDPRTGVLAVRGPELADAGAATVSFPLVARAGSPVVAAPGEDIRLPVLSGAPPVDMEQHSASFTLVVRSTCAPSEAVSYVSMSAQGPVPSELRVSRAVLPEPLPSPLAACLQASASYAPATAPYPTNASLFARLAWHLAP